MDVKGTIILFNDGTPVKVLSKYEPPDRLGRKLTKLKMRFLSTEDRDELLSLKQIVPFELIEDKMTIMKTYYKNDFSPSGSRGGRSWFICKSNIDGSPGNVRDEFMESRAQYIEDLEATAFRAEGRGETLQEEMLELQTQHGKRVKRTLKEELDPIVKMFRKASAYIYRQTDFKPKNLGPSPGIIPEDEGEN